MLEDIEIFRARMKHVVEAIIALDDALIELQTELASPTSEKLLSELGGCPICHNQKVAGKWTCGKRHCDNRFNLKTKKPYKCADCGSIITNRGRLCQSCSHIKRTKTNQPPQ